MSELFFCPNALALNLFKALRDANVPVQGYATEDAVTAMYHSGVLALDAFPLLTISVKETQLGRNGLVRHSVEIAYTSLVDREVEVIGRHRVAAAKAILDRLRKERGIGPELAIRYVSFVLGEVYALAAVVDITIE
jgi:hypothetical protein